MTRSKTNLNFAIVAVVALALFGCGVKGERSEKQLPRDKPTAKALDRPQAEPTESPQPDPLELQENALAALRSGDTVAALELGRRAISATPDDPQTIFLMARILAARNRFPEAIRMLDRLAEEVPDARLPVMGQTTEWLMLQGQWDQAEQRYRILLDEVGESRVAMAERMLSQLLLRQGRRLEAAIHLNKLCRAGDVNEFELRSLLIGVHPLPNESKSGDDLEPIGAMGRARYAISQGDWDAALKELDPSTTVRPAEAALRGRIYADQRDYASLDQSVNQMPESAREFADYWFALGAHQAQRDDHHAAVKSFCQVVLRDQTDSQAYMLMSHSLEQMGMSTEAAEASERGELIEQTQTVGNEIVAYAGNQDKITTLIDALDGLHRPFEALAWRALLVVLERSSSQLSDSQALKEINEINRTRLDRVTSNEPAATERYLLCGVDLDSL